MRNALLRSGLTFAITCVTAGVLVAQEPMPRPDPADQPQARDDRMVTATGCLKQEKDVPGGQPNVAERAGLGEDFILTKARITEGSAGSAQSNEQTPSDPSAPSGASARAGRGAMYKVAGLDDELLRSHINQQVQVQGRLVEQTTGMLTPEANPPTGDRQTAPDEVQQIRATSIKMIAGTCTTGTN